MAVTRVSTDGLADSAVNSAKIGVDVITDADLANNSVTVNEISDNAVSSAKLAAGASLANIGAGTIAGDKLATNIAITTSGNVTLTGTVKTPYIAVNNDIYTCSGTLTFDTVNNNRYYQGFDLRHAQRRYGNMHTDGIAFYYPSNSAVSYGPSNMPSSTGVSTWIDNKNLFNVWAGIQYWRVPKTATYTIRCKGAGSGIAGHGRDVQADFDLNAGEWLRIICGAQGKTNGSTFAGGAGASCASVIRHGLNQPLIVAGGGGGRSENINSYPVTDRHARAPATTTDAAEYNTLSGGNEMTQRGGMGGMGSVYSTSYSSWIENWGGGGGGGWFTEGGGGGIGYNTMHQDLSGGGALSSMPRGGHYFPGNSGYWGGFGGGGYTGTQSGAAGGGGGWDGGNSEYVGVTSTPGDISTRGGGSWVAEITNLTDHGATRTDYGQVLVTVPS